MAVTLGALAVRYGCELRGDPGVVVERVATLARAGPGTLTFLANPHYRSQLAATQAAAVVLAAEDAGHCPVACLVSENPYLAYARLAAELHPPPPLRAGVAPGAVIGEDCRLAPDCQIEPGACVGPGTVIAARVYIGANVTVGAHCVIGEDTRIMGGVALYDRVRIGRRCLVHSGAIIGADGFGIAREASGAWVKVPQVGAVVIGDDVEIGANTTIDRGAIEDTVIGNGVKLDNLVQIGHNVSLGAHTAMAGMSGVSGSTRVGERCIIGGLVGLAGHITVVDDVVITGGSKVSNSILRPGLYSGTIPADEARRWRKNAVRFGQLDELARRVRQLERALGRQGGDER